MPTVVVGIASEIDSALAVIISKTPTGKIVDPVSMIIRDILISNSIGVAAATTGGTSGSSSDWPIFIINTPDTPDNILTIFDTAGTKHGRLMFGGKTLMNPGIQVQVRSNSYLFGWQKSNAVLASLSEEVLNETVVIGGNTYKVAAISITSGPLPLGKQPPESKRYLFTVNGTVSLIKRT